MPPLGAGRAGERDVRSLPHAREIIAQSAKHYSGRSLRTVLACREVLVYYSGDAEKGNPERRE